MPRSAKTPFDDLDESEVLSPRDIADRLHVHERSVRRAIARGELVASRACGLHVLAADAAAWWVAQMVDPDGRGPDARPALKPASPPARQTPRLGRRRLSAAGASVRGGGR